MSDTTGVFFWREVSPTVHLVAVWDGVTRWRTPLRRGSERFLFSALLLRNDLLVDAYGSTLEARSTSDGRVVWSRDLGGEISAAAKVGRAVVTAAASASAGWLTATAANGRTLWRSRLRGPVARMAANGDRLYLLMSITSAGEPPVIVVDSSGRLIPDAQPPFEMNEAAIGAEIVFTGGYAVTATIAPVPMRCPPNSPSCRPSPLMLTVAGFSAGQTRWHFTQPPRGLEAQLVLLSDGAVLLVDTAGVRRISADGAMTQVCENPMGGHWSVAGLVRGNLVVAYHDSVAAYALPDVPRLGGTGWVMRGGGPARDWAVRRFSSPPQTRP